MSTRVLSLLLPLLLVALLGGGPSVASLQADPAEGRLSSGAAFIHEKTVLYEALKEMIRQARKNVLVRIFVISDNDGVLFSSPEDQPPMAADFAQLLIERKRANPELDIVVILDPINFVEYHQAYEYPWQRWAEKLRAKGRFFRGFARILERMITVNQVYPERYEALKEQTTIRELLRANGITVLSSNLLQNPEYNRLFSPRPGRDDPADEDDMRMRAIRRLPDEYTSVMDRVALEKKLALYQTYTLVGDHRKFAVIDDGTMGWNASMNVWDNDFYSPDDGVVVTGELARGLLHQFEEAREKSLELYEHLYRAGKAPELAAQYERGPYRYAPRPVHALELPERRLELAPAEGRLLRDGAIADYFIETLGRLEPGSTADIYQTLITDPDMIGAIVGAAERGVKIRLITDSYENVYGKDASFIHGVAFRRFRKCIEDGHSLEVRAVVPDPRISEIHRKFALFRGELEGQGPLDVMISGSANFTLHSADGSQLELDVLFTDGAVREQARTFFDDAWNNRREEEQNFVPRLIRERWKLKDRLITGGVWMFSLFGLGG